MIGTCICAARAGKIVYKVQSAKSRSLLARAMQNGPWQYNVFHPSTTFQYQELQGQNPYNYNTASSRWAAPTLATGGGSQSPSIQGPAPAHQPAGPSPSRDQDYLSTATSTYTVALKVLNPQNKKDYTMFTLRDLTEEDLSSPNSIKEAIFVQVGEDIVSRKLDFQVGFTKKSQNVD